jgi:hypothetical protein
MNPLLGYVASRTKAADLARSAERRTRTGEAATPRGRIPIVAVVLVGALVAWIVAV